MKQRTLIATLTLALFTTLAFAQESGGMMSGGMMSGGASDMPATVVDIALSDDNFSTLVAALDTAGLVETLQGEGPFTVFAPTNDAFEALLGDLGISAEELLARDDLADILTYHVVPQQLLAADVLAAVDSAGGTAEVETVNGEALSVSLDGDSVVINGTATVTTTDLQAGNGVVHVIDAVLVPGQ